MASRRAPRALFALIGLATHLATPLLGCSSAGAGGNTTAEGRQPRTGADNASGGAQEGPGMRCMPLDRANWTEDLRADNASAAMGLCGTMGGMQECRRAAWCEWAELRIVDRCGAGPSPHAENLSTPCSSLSPHHCRLFAEQGLCRQFRGVTVVSGHPAVLPMRISPHDLLLGAAAAGAVWAVLILWAWLSLLCRVASASLACGCDPSHVGVVVTVTCHIADIALDVAAAVVFFNHDHYVFMCLSIAFIASALLTGIMSKVLDYASHRKEDFDFLPGGMTLQGLAAGILCTILQLHIFVYAHDSIKKGKKTSQLMLAKMTQAAFESMPSAVLQVYSLVCCAPHGRVSWIALIASVCSGLMSLTLAFMDMDHQVCAGTIGKKIWNFFFRAFELTSRIFLVALFAHVIQLGGAMPCSGAPRWMLTYLAVEFAVMFAVTIHFSDDKNCWDKFFVSSLLSVSLLAAGPSGAESGAFIQIYYWVRVCSSLAFACFIGFALLEPGPRAVLSEQQMWIASIAVSALACFVLMRCVEQVAPRGADIAVTDERSMHLEETREEEAQEGTDKFWLLCKCDPSPTLK